MDELLGEFIAETRETLEALAGEVVAWEADPDDRARLDSIFRFVHTVKGSCGFLDLPRLERLSHAAEDVLADVRAGRRATDQALVSAVLAVIDRIGELTDAIESGESLPDAEDQVLIAALAPGALAEPEPAAGVVQAVAQTRAASRSIRLPVDLLDRMMAGVSDMVLARNELSRRLRDAGMDNGIEVSFERLSICVAEMRDAITRTRMTRIDHLFSAIPRMVRDLSAELGKLVALEIDGGDVELDREMIEMIRDPLTHIIRNAIDHGIEMPEERQRAGKPTSGLLRVGARQAGNQILIEVSDDGKGIDGERLAQRAIAAGVISAHQAESMTIHRKQELIFEPGLSTAKAVTAISGRGVGMDVVRSNVQRIGGVVEIDSRPQQGLRLVLRVPLTLTIIPALTVSAGGQQFAIPRSAIDEIVRVNGETVRLEALGGAMTARIRGQRLPLVSLIGLIDGGDAAAEILVVLKPAGAQRYALAVDTVHDHEELVVKPAAPAVMATGIYAGTTLPDNSRPMLLLDVAGIAHVAGLPSEENMPAERADPEAPQEANADLAPTLLFRGLDGADRAVRLALVERIEDVPAEAASETAGRLRLTHDGRIVPLMGVDRAIDRPRLRVLRMSDGANQLAYAIDGVIDIIAIGSDFAPAAKPGPILGVALVDGRPVELIDSHWLFAQASMETKPRLGRPLCLFAHPEDPWLRQVLAPLVDAAGYDVVFAGDKRADEAAVVIESASAEVAETPVKAPVVRLRAEQAPSDAEDGSIWRYDRSGLIAALDARAAAGGRK